MRFNDVNVNRQNKLQTSEFPSTSGLSSGLLSSSGLSLSCRVRFHFPSFSTLFYIFSHGTRALGFS